MDKSKAFVYTVFLQNRTHLIRIQYDLVRVAFEEPFALKPLVIDIPAFSEITVVEQRYRADISLIEGSVQLIVPVDSLIADRVCEILEGLSIEYDPTFLEPLNTGYSAERCDS